MAAQKRKEDTCHENVEERVALRRDERSGNGPIMFVGVVATLVLPVLRRLDSHRWWAMRHEKPGRIGGFC